MNPLHPPRCYECTESVDAPGRSDCLTHTSFRLAREALQPELDAARREIQELTARVQLLTRQRDEARASNAAAVASAGAFLDAAEVLIATPPPNSAAEVLALDEACAAVELARVALCQALGRPVTRSLLTPMSPTEAP